MIRRLAAGAGFADLAKEFSKDATAQAGGDLGYAGLSMLPPELGAVAFALSPGQVTQYPVRINESYLVVKVEERRVLAAPSFDQARDALRQEVARRVVPRLMASALKASAPHFHGTGGRAKTAGPN